MSALAGLIRDAWASERLTRSLEPSLDDYLESLAWRYARGQITVDELEAKIDCALRDGPPPLWLQFHRTDRPGAIIYYDPEQGTPTYSAARGAESEDPAHS